MKIIDKYQTQGRTLKNPTWCILSFGVQSMDNYTPNKILNILFDYYYY